MTSKYAHSQHDGFLEKLAEEIDIPKSIYDEVVSRYESLGRWLERDNSSLKDLNALIAPQGSFRLGTAIQPIHDCDDVDVDLICRLAFEKSDLSQKQLKILVGREIQAYAKAMKMRQEPKDSRRCWTLNYEASANFHMDILPCIPDTKHYRQKLFDSGHVQIARSEDITKDAIAITDKQDENYSVISDEWPSSNPIGYAEWFRSRMRRQLITEKVALASRKVVADAESIPDHEVKTTLQKAIQLLKRHRDNMFADDPENKPISIIITTLAAKSYNNEGSLGEALESILNTMDDHIDELDGEKWVANPVNPEENFADKWAECPEKETRFNDWLKAARQDFGRYLNLSEPQNVPVQLEERIGKAAVAKALDAAGLALAIGAAVKPAVAHSDRLSDAVNDVNDRGAGTAPWGHHGKL